MRKIKLAQKTFIYGLIIALLVGTLIVSYMIFLLPSLYMDQKMTNNFNSIKNSHAYFLESGKYGGNTDDISTNILGIKLYKEGYKLKFSSNAFEGNIEIENPKLKNILDDMRNTFKDESYKDNFEKTNKKVETYSKEIGEVFKEISNPMLNRVKQDLNLDFKLFEDTLTFQNKRQKFYTVGNNTMILESALENSKSKTEYTSYIAMTIKDDQMYISCANVVTPTPNEIRPVMINTIPVILVVTVLLAFGISSLFAKNIVKPIVILSRDVNKRRFSNAKDIKPMEILGNDEIAELGQSLNLLYEQEAKSLSKLEEESTRKEVFMKALSHQLKTPVASASLLVDSMISNIGKFSNRDVYLPEVKNELNSMKKILSEILEIDKLAKNPNFYQIDIKDLVENLVQRYDIGLKSKNLKVEIVGDSTWETDGDIMYQIMDNLISNAIKYTDDNGYVKIGIEKDRLSVINKPARLEESLKLVIFEPFVTGKVTEDGNGLGLYVVKYFAESLNMSVNLENDGEEVKFVIKNERN